LKNAKSTGTGKYEKLLAVCSKLSPLATDMAYRCIAMRMAHARWAGSGKSS
jgi:hypothetical protein